MRHGAALAGALAAGVCALIAGPGLAGTVEILASDPACCSISGGLNPQDQSAGTAKGESPAGDWPSESGDAGLANEVASGGSERAGDSLGPDAVAIKESGGAGDDPPDGVSSVAGPEPSVLTRVLMIFADLRATVFGSPYAAPRP
jgi:hypothetical protein